MLGVLGPVPGQNPVSAIFSSPATATTPRMIITGTATIRLLNREAAPAPGEPTRPVHRGLYIRAPRLAGCKSNQVPDMIQHTLVHLSLPILFLKTARIFWARFLCSDRLVHHNLSCHNHRVRRPTDLGGSFDGILQPSAMLFEPEDRSAELEVKATTWSAPAIANTTRKPNKLTPAKQANGSARGTKKRAGIVASPLPPNSTLDQTVSRAIYFSLSVNVSFSLINSRSGTLQAP